MKKAIITGATSGLGLEIAKQLSKNNVQIVNLSRKKSKFIDITLDLSGNEQISQATKIILDKHATFDLLILNAGIMPIAPVGKINFDIDEMFKVNITSSIKLVNSLLPLIKKNKADIVFVGSTASLKGYPNHAAYCASKHAVDGFVKSLQVELKDDAVRVIGFHPGGFNSNLRGGVVKKGFMDAKYLATLLLNILELPKNMEVSQVVINRKK